MATTIVMPQLGETVTEGTVAAWLKRPGDRVEKYEPFVEVSTDKVNAEVPSPVSGVLREIIAAEGQTVPTGAPIAIIDEVAAGAEPRRAPAPPGGVDPSTLPPLAAAAAVAAGGSAAAGNGAGPSHRMAPVPASYGAAGDDGAPYAATSGNGAAASAPAGGDPLAALLRTMSPAVRRLAREHAVDVSAVRGTGTSGRITARDVLAAAKGEGPSAAMAAGIARWGTIQPMTPASNGNGAAAGGNGAAPAAPAAPVAPAASEPLPAETSTYAAPRRGTVIVLSQARRIIASRTVEALAAAPHAWTMVEVDVTGAWRWRQAEKDRFARDHGVPLTFLSFFVSAVAGAVGTYPLVNARYVDGAIHVHRALNVGVAVGLDGNLVVPVVRDADRLTIGGLAIALGRTVERARAGKLGADDLAGGTFTVNNTGANGSVMSKPIIVGGQAGIVTMEAIVKRPVVVADDAIAVRSMMNVCLSLDHRVLDGTVANGFLGEVKRRLEAMRPGGDL